MRKTALCSAVLGSLSVTACVETASEPDVSTEAQEITIVPAGTSCSALGYGAQEFRIDYPVDGQYAIDAANSLLFRYYDETETIFFYTQSTLRINAVMVTAAGQSAVWDTNGSNGWPSLGLYLNGVAQQPESVSFCFDYELFLNPNAYAHYGQSQGWSLAKSSTTNNLLLSLAQTYVAEYSVTVTPRTATPQSLFIEGPVFVNNRAPQAATFTAVTVKVGELDATVTCPGTAPYTVPAFTTMTCEFHVDVPDTSDRLVYVDVVGKTSTQLVGRSVETASFADHTTSTHLFDRCVRVYDDHVAGEFLGTVCAADGAKTFTYSAPVGPFAACGPFEVENTAWIEGIDSGNGDSATYAIAGDVPCTLGCTLTPGYWKTHSTFGPAPYDSVWASLPGGLGAETPFFLSGTTYYRVLWTPTQGNAYYTLARAYIAAELNKLDGADTRAISSALTQAKAILQAYGPADPALGKKTLTRTQALAAASTLDDYNNGRIGPGHCDE
ncbi:MAG TPA: hypothetical protein VM261_32940 [Kofleriaceae bacterium]|nr:hypothetical protein [Kofleriaceae bacterium]